MKANQAYKHQEEAVSAVVGVILLVAITVVLAAIVFVIATKLSSNNADRGAPDVGLARDDSNDRINVIASENGVTWREFAIVSDASGTNAVRYEINSPAGAMSNGLDGGMRETFSEMSSMDGGDYISFCATGGLNNVNIKISHVETNSAVYETSFQTLHAC